MRIGLSAPTTEDAARAVRAFQLHFTGPRNQGWRLRRVLHAHGSFGRGQVTSPDSAALRTALFMLSLGPPIETVWVPQLDLLYGLDLGAFPFAVRGLDESGGEARIEAWLSLDQAYQRPPSLRPPASETPPSE